MSSSRVRLPTVDVQNCSDNEDIEEISKHSIKSPTVLTPPHCTPRSASPVVTRSPIKSKDPKDPSTSSNQPKQYLQVGNPSSIFRLPKPQVIYCLSPFMTFIAFRVRMYI